MLTKKQRELLMFIYERVRETGVSPSFDEMKEALGLKSKSGIHRLITALEERGFIKRLAHRARAVEILKLPDNAAPLGSGGNVRPSGFSPSVIEGSFGKPHAVPDYDSGDAVSVPILGRIAAGTPIEALQHKMGEIAVPPDFMASGDHYALEVQGDSMIEAGIFDGDVVVIQKGDTATNGDIVVALVDDEEATLKRMRKKGGVVALEAANPAYETRIFGPDRIKVQGRLVGLMRRY